MNTTKIAKLCETRVYDKFLIKGKEYFRPPRMQLDPSMWCVQETGGRGKWEYFDKNTEVEILGRHQ